MARMQKGLGRGLDALISDGASEGAARSSSGVRVLAVDQLSASPWQPRRNFDEAALAELVASVREHGVLQPLLVRRVQDRFEVIAGERRLRAAREAGLRSVPVVEMTVDDEQVLEIALIENLQREDLNPIEEAEGYALLQKQFALTLEQVAQKVGKARPSISNALRLLDLPDSVRDMVRDGSLSAGHAKVLLGLPNAAEMERFAQRIQAEGLSVRALEKAIKAGDSSSGKKEAGRSDLPESALRTLSDELHQFFGAPVRLIPSRTRPDGHRSKGSITIDFGNNDELERLLALVGYAQQKER